LQQEYPESVELAKPASADEIASTERRLGLRLGDLDPEWPEFLRLTNGAAILDNWFYSATLRRRDWDIASENVGLWDLDCYRWLKERFVAFLEMSGPDRVGFVREGSRPRCVAYHCELDDTAALPIASSFGRFLSGLLHDAEATLREAARAPGAEPPQYIPGIWPFDLKPWVGRDPELRRMLQRGELDDVYRGDREYAAYVESALLELGGPLARLKRYLRPGSR